MARDGDHAQQMYLINLYKPLMDRIISRTRITNQAHEDIEQECIIALLNSIKIYKTNFDSNVGRESKLENVFDANQQNNPAITCAESLKFYSYLSTAFKTIARRINNESTNIVHLPNRARAILWEYSQMGKPLNSEELLKRYGISEATVKIIIAQFGIEVSKGTASTANETYQDMQCSADINEITSHYESHDMETVIALEQTIDLITKYSYLFSRKHLDYTYQQECLGKTSVELAAECGRLSNNVRRSTHRTLAGMQSILEAYGIGSEILNCDLKKQQSVRY